MSEERGAIGRDPADAVSTLVDEYGGQLYALAVRFCGDRTEAEDLVQDVFLEAFRNWETFRGEASPRTWLYTIAARRCQRMHRKRSGEPARIASLEELLPFDEARVAVIAGEQEDGLQRQIRSEARERIEGAIASLAEEFRIPLVLKEIVGLSVAEIATILGLEEGTVRSRVHRARLKLRASVDEALPRQKQEAPPPAYPLRTCMDLLEAKQKALDQGVLFDSDVICERCRSVFASLDLTRDICSELGSGRLPEEVRERLMAALRRGGEKI